MGYPGSLYAQLKRQWESKENVKIKIFGFFLNKFIMRSFKRIKFS